MPKLALTSLHLTIGGVVDFKGISGGIENTNYFVTTQIKGQPQQDFVLTLFEDLSYDEMPYFVDLTEHLVANNVTVPAPLRDQDGAALSLLLTNQRYYFLVLQAII